MAREETSLARVPSAKTLVAAFCDHATSCCYEKKQFVLNEIDALGFESVPR